MSYSRFPKQGPSFTPAYQISGVPFVTSSNGSEIGTTVPVKIEFPFVTRWIQVRNTGDRVLRVGFTSRGVSVLTEDQNYFQLNPSNSASGFSQARTDVWEIRCKEIWVVCQSLTPSDTTGFSLCAGLTGIESFPVITGSNGFKGVG